MAEGCSWYNPVVIDSSNDSSSEADNPQFIVEGLKKTLNDSSSEVDDQDVVQESLRKPINEFSDEIHDSDVAIASLTKNLEGLSSPEKKKVKREFIPTKADVATTQYEHLLLRNRRSREPPVMVGPMMVHQKKEETTYKILPEFIAAEMPKFKHLCAVGTDGEVALSRAILDVCPGATHLICFSHFCNNIKDHLKSVGVNEGERKQLVADIFGQQVGTTFEEGIVDSDDVEEFDTRLASLRYTWAERLGDKGRAFYTWFVKYKSRLMKDHLLKPVRKAAGLGDVPKRYVTNRIECVNSLLQRETEHRETPVDQFVTTMQGLIERQARNVKWAIIDKGPFKLHPSLCHFILPAELWFSMSPSEKDEYMEMVMKSDVPSGNQDVSSAYPTNREMELSAPPTNQDTAVTHVDGDNLSADADNLSALDILANAALAQATDPDGESTCKLSVTFPEFQNYLEGQPIETLRGMWNKANELVSIPRKMSTAPGCDPSCRMVASRRYKSRPHLVTKGKAKGEYRCEKNCPHWSGIKLCSHTIAAAQSNAELVNFLTWFKSKRGSKATNLTSVVHTDMPAHPGRKGGVPVTSRRGSNKLAVEERRKRTYSAPPLNAANTNSLFVKKVHTRIKVCQGCRGSIKASGGKMPLPPFDYCVARKERRPYKDKNGQICTPCRETDAHYHLRAPCLLAEEPSFDLTFLVVADDIGLTPAHKTYIAREFGLDC